MHLVKKNYLVIDLEATCDQPQLPNEKIEIIEIGAAFVNSRFEVVSTYEGFVKPVVFQTLTPFCTQLTTITQDQVDSAPEFVEACVLFDAWVSDCVKSFGEVEFWGSWGQYDYAQFIRNAELLKVDIPKFMSIEHRNLKQVYGKSVGLKRGPGLKKTLGYEKMSFEGTQHRALADVLNIVRVLPVAVGSEQSKWNQRPNRQ